MALYFFDVDEGMMQRDEEPDLWSATSAVASFTIFRDQSRSWSIPADAAGFSAGLCGRGRPEMGRED